jgi:uncharacterized membrane protein
MALTARRRGGALLIAAALVYEALVHLAFTRPDAQLLWVVPLTGLPHAAAYLFLLWLFSRTLRPGEEALITSVARRFHGPIPPWMESYTRRLTAAWCLFFAAQLLGSAGLLAFASFETWSLFVNVLNLPLVAGMFALDYLYRKLRFRGYPHASIAQSIDAFAKHRRLSG